MPKRKGAGRPIRKKTESEAKIAEEMARHGVPEDNICAALHMSKRTLHELYEEDMDRGRADAMNKVGSTLYEAAVGGNITAAIFYAKTRMGWSEKNIIEHSGGMGVSVQADPGKVLEAIKAITGNK